MIITIAIFLIIDFCLELLQAYKIYDNIYFDPFYLYGYIFLLLIFFVAVVIISIYLFSRDSKETRAILPWGFLIAAIANLLLFFWILYYILFVYDKGGPKYVLVKGMDEDEDGYRER